MFIGQTGPGKPPDDGEMSQMNHMTPSNTTSEIWRSEAEHSNSLSQRLPIVLNLYRRGTEN